MTTKRILLLASMIVLLMTLATVLAVQRPLSTANAQPADQIPEFDLRQMEAEFSRRETGYREQLDLLEGVLDQRRATYEGQVAVLDEAVAAGHRRLAELTAQEIATKEELSQLAATAAAEQASLQNRRAEAGEIYATRYNTMMAQLAEVQAKLAEARQILGR